MVKLDFGDLDDLRPLIEQVIQQTLAAVESSHAKLGDRLGFTEPEAASVIGVAPHVLRDCRLRGEITARLVGKKYVYSREVLVRFLCEGTK